MGKIGIYLLLLFVIISCEESKDPLFIDGEWEMLLEMTSEDKKLGIIEGVLTISDNGFAEITINSTETKLSYSWTKNHQIINFINIESGINIDYSISHIDDQFIILNNGHNIQMNLYRIH